jgi:hypothetical protein
MANDLAAMIFRIVGELGNRSDLGGAVGSANASQPNAEAIRNAINTAISVYQKQRFRFNEIDPGLPTTFNTVAGQSVYSSADNPLISSAYWIDYLMIAIGNTLMELSQETPLQQHRNIQLFNQSGMPTSWAYEGNSIILYPVPVAVFPVYLGAHIFKAAPATDSEANNVWMMPNQGERLIRCRAKYEIYTHVTHNLDQMKVLSPEDGETYRAWRSLKAEGNKITSTRARVKPMAF